MICWNKWKRYIGLGCLLVMLLVSTVVIWQSETKEESLSAMVQTEDVIKTDDYIELRIARDRHRST